MYKLLIRPFLFKFLPETAHNLTLRALGLLSRIPLATAVLRCIYDCKTTCLEQELFGLRFPHPVGLAAGLDKNGEYYNELSCFGFSFIEIGSLTPKPQSGNPKPRLFRLPRDKAIINRMGINNKGIRHAIDNLNEDPPGMILVASIAKNSSSSSDEEIQKDYETAFSLLYDFVDMFTLNISCPNVEGVQSLQDVSFLSDIVDPLLDLRLCYDVYKPVLVKVSPDLPFEQLDEILDYCMLSGIDGIVAEHDHFARRTVRESGADPGDRARRAFRRPAFPENSGTGEAYSHPHQGQTADRRLRRDPDSRAGAGNAGCRRFPAGNLHGLHLRRARPGTENCQVSRQPEEK